MKNPAPALNLRLRTRSSTELLLPLLLFGLLLSLSFPFHLVHSKSDTTSNREEPAQWQILTKNNFSSHIRLNPHILLIVTVPWSGESRALMKELAHMVGKKKDEFKTLKLMLVYKNQDKMLADALGATMETNIICYRHSLPYKYQGTIRVQSILSSAHYLMSLLPEDIPFKSLPTAHDLTTFLESTDKAFLVLEFCGWTPKLMAKVMSNRSENAFGVPVGGGLYGGPSEPDGIKNQGVGNEKIPCDEKEFSGLPGLGEFAPLNETDFLESEKTRSSDESSCSFEEFQLFESSLYNLTTSVRDLFLPPERLKFGLVSERSLISSLGVGDTSSWLMMLYHSGCPGCAKVFKEGSDLKRIIDINPSPVMELKGDEYDLDPGLPSDRPSVLLFIDRSSDSLKTRRKSKESLTTFRQLALHNHSPSKTNPQKPFSVSQHPKLEMSTLSSQKVTVIKDKILIMSMKEGNQHITFDDLASNLQGSGSLQEVLTQVLQKKKERKLSSLAKDVGFQLLSDDIDITIPETDVQSVSDDMDSTMTVTETVTETVTGVNCSFFFIDGPFRLLQSLAGKLKIPSLVIINPNSHQHYVYPQETDFDFSYKNISNFLHMFMNGSLVPYQKSGSVVPDLKEAPRPPFVNQDFHEVDSVPRVNALSFMELIVGNQSGSHDIIRKDVLVLFTSSWCGFCLRTELVVREVYQAFKDYSNMVKSQLKKVNVKLPLIYMVDCTENDCCSLLKSSTKRDIYPSLLLYPSQSQEAISYDGETTVHNIIKFIADQGSDSHWIYKERGLWTEVEQEEWKEKPIKEPLIHEDVTFSNEILLKDRSGSHKLEPENNNNNNIVPQTYVHEILPGSILVATQKLHNIYPFAKSKILIVNVNTSTGFQGLIINKHISWDTITRLEEGLDSLKEAPLSYGGPVIARELPLVSLTREEPSGNNNEYSQVLPDVYFLDQWSTINLIQNLKLHNRSMTDYWFFVGYSSWGWAQLFDEIADGSWNVIDGSDHKFDWPI